MGEHSAASPPCERDEWRRNRDRLAWLIDQIRVAVPLLDRRALDGGEPAAVELDEALLSIARSRDGVEIQLTPPRWCSDAEAQRVIAIAAACVTPAPGWHLIRGGDKGRISAVLGVRHAEAHVR